MNSFCQRALLTLQNSDRPKLYTIFAFLSAVGLKERFANENKHPFMDQMLHFNVVNIHNSQSSAYSPMFVSGGPPKLSLSNPGSVFIELNFMCNKHRKSWLYCIAFYYIPINDTPFELPIFWSNNAENRELNYFRKFICLTISEVYV